MQEKLITVTKTVCDKQPPDTADISVTAAGTAKKYAEAVSSADEAAAAVTAALKGAGFEVRSLGVNVSAVREAGKVTGYRASRALSLHFSLEKARLGAALEELGKSNCEWRLSYSLKDNKKRSELLTRAVREARADAEVMAAAADVKLGAMSKAEYNSSEEGGARPMVMRVSLDGPSAEPELITLTETVTCAWEIE